MTTTHSLDVELPEGLRIVSWVLVAECVNLSDDGPSRTLATFTDEEITPWATVGMLDCALDEARADWAAVQDLDDEE